jgi:hypothetical protein
VDYDELTPDELHERLVVEEMIDALEAYKGRFSAERDEILRRLRGNEYLYFVDDELRNRARNSLEMIGVGCYVFYSFNHFGRGNGRFLKVGSSVHAPESRAHSHLLSSSSQSDIVGKFGPEYVSNARLGLIVFPCEGSVARAMDRYLNDMLDPEI